MFSLKHIIKETKWLTFFYFNISQKKKYKAFSFFKALSEICSNIYIQGYQISVNPINSFKMFILFLKIIVPRMKKWMSNQSNNAKQVL